MTARERQASGGAVLAQRPPAPRPSLGAPTAPAPGLPPSWAELYHHLTATQRHELLDLATQQGLVCGDQVPTVEATSSRRSALAALLAGRQPELPSIVITPRAVHDSALDLYQQQAVWRALQSPDVCLIHGQPGTGKSRVAAEILRQAAEQRLRVLFVAPCTAGLDQVLRRVHDYPAILALRCLHTNETPAQLPREIHALTLAERVRHLRDEASAAARAAETTAEQQVKQLAQKMTMASELESLLGRSAELATQEAELAGQLGSEVLPATAEMQTVMTQRDQERDRQRQLVAEVEQSQKALAQRRQPLQYELDTLLPLVAAKQTGQWWTSSWWRATFQSAAVKQSEELAQQLRALDTEAQQLTKKLATLTAEAARADSVFSEKLKTLQHQEHERRQAELNERLAEVRQRSAAVTGDCQRLQGELQVATPDALTARREQWRAEQVIAQQRFDFARRWTQSLETAGANWPERIVQLVNVVAVTVNALALDPHFGDKSNATFDLLLVDEAEQLTEADFQALARRCGRSVLIGEASREESPRPVLNKAHRSSIVRPGVFQRLWQQLHCDPRRLPARWHKRGERLCCQLRSVAPEQERWAEREPVVDRHDVELTIVSPPRTEPILAEVSFPLSTAVDDAKRFIFGEVQELSIQSAASGCHWTEEGTCFRLHLGGTPTTGDVAVKLLDGVTEWVRATAANQFHTVALEFCGEAGWKRDRAEEWLRTQSSLRDCGRTMVLPRVHRLHPDLAAIIHDLQGEGVTAPDTKDVVPSWGHWNAPLVFVPVPGLRGLRRNGPRPRFEARGAGLEYDLSDTAHPPQLPPELRHQLSKPGLVNYMEAEAVVHAVETLVTDAAFRRDNRTPLAVTALYVAQVKLLHLMLRASPVLSREKITIVGPDDGACRDGGFCVEVNLPPAWKQGEFSGLLVSLTRSHSHRAVAYGEYPGWLPLTLTRARTRLVLFGDPGTLVRRAQWQGALDRLDETTAMRERDLVAQLVQYLQGQGLHSDRFQLCEGSSA